MRYVFAAILLSFVCLVRLAGAQTVSATSGTINGKVTDKTDASLPGVTVNISSPSMMGTRSAVTTEDGMYRFPGVPPGAYTVVFELAGFSTLKREDIRVTLGFTATVNVELVLASVEENVTVVGRSPVVDAQSTKMTTNFDAKQLANLPSARDYMAVLAESPALRISTMDVGGSRAGSQTGYQVYGTTGQNRPMLEGINATETTGAFGHYVDYGSFEEIAVSTAAHGADMAVPGVQTNFISKSGGNTYHGAFYADNERQNWQSFNIDADQIARGVTGGGGLSPRDTNRLYSYHDVNADIGGYIKKDKLWWYFSTRDVNTSVRFTNFPVEPHPTHLTNLTGKVTYQLNTNNKLIGYTAPSRKIQPLRLDRMRLGATTAIHNEADSTFNQHTWNILHKGEWDSVLSNTLFFEIRAGEWGYNSVDTNHTTTPSFEDVGNNLSSGAARQEFRYPRRDQVLGSLSYFKDEWWGLNHNFKFGWEVFKETLNSGELVNSYNDVLHILRNNAPIEVYLFQNPSDSKNGMWAYGAYANDTWRATNRLTLNLGVRFDRYRDFLDDQEHQAGRFNPAPIQFAGVNNLIAFNVPAPRVGMSYDLTGGGKTVLKVNYGKYWWNPGYALSGNVNPNPVIWYRDYAWTDPNGNGVWDPGEEGRLIATAGGVATESIDPNLKDTFTREVVIGLERELITNFALRTGFVWRGERQRYQRSDANQPFSAFTVPTTVRDPGPDGVLGNADDGPSIAAFNLATDRVGLTPNNVTSNVPNSDADFYTWEMVGTKRMSNSWSLLAAFAYTWNQQNPLATVTPNALINAENGRLRFTDWSAKLHGTWQARWGLVVTPILRYQAGPQFARTINASLNYGNVTIRVEPMESHRQRNTTLVDTRVEKVFPIGHDRRISGFVDVFNMFNTNADVVNTTSGTSWFRPLSVTAPRIVRLGAKVDW